MFKLMAIAVILVACDAQRMDEEMDKVDIENVHLARMQLMVSRLAGRAALMESLLESYREGIKWVDRYLP